jgi:hypothetical protein
MLRLLPLAVTHESLVTASKQATAINMGCVDTTRKKRNACGIIGVLALTLMLAGIFLTRCR